MGRVIVVGWDGATWDLLFPLMKRGVLPSLGQLVNESAFGPLKSTTPPVTAPSWITIATGVNPARHGCFDFNKADGALAKIRPLQSWDIQTKTFYELLEEKNKPFVLINLPGTYPPLTKGVTLTSLLTQGNDAVFPKNLENEYKVLNNYRIFPDTTLLRKGRLSEYLADIYDVEQKRFEAMKALWERDWELMFIVFSGGDWVSHELYGELLEDRAPAEAENVFKLMDEALSWILRRMKTDDSLMMVSDHGFKKAKGVVHLNEILCRKGYLVPDYQNPSPPPSHKMEEGSFKKEDFKKPPAWLLKGGRENDLVRYGIKAFRKLGGSYPLFLRPDSVNSKASLFTSESYGVTIHEKDRYSDGKVEAEAVPILKDSIRNELRNLSYDGAEVFSEVLFREEVYEGSFMADAPHIILGDSDWALSSAIRTLENDPFAVCQKGIHSKYGIFLGYGQAFKKAEIPASGLKVEDIAPNILYLLNETVPEGLDGRVMEKWIEKEYLDRQSVRYCPSTLPQRESGDLEGEEIQKRLKSLGYMS
jgi:predicted AlkP superfamily phosphohydrolase/phosphomutase